MQTPQEGRESVQIHGVHKCLERGNASMAVSGRIYMCNGWWSPKKVLHQGPVRMLFMKNLFDELSRKYELMSS